MLFKPELAEKIIRGEKFQTRRVVKAGEELRCDTGWSINSGLEWEVSTPYAGFLPHNIAVKYRIKWRVNRSYAVCPGRGKAQVARIRITNIRQECVGDISEADAVAEGFTGRDEFLRVFKQINPKSGLNTPVWVLTFELVKG